MIRLPRRPTSFALLVDGSLARSNDVAVSSNANWIDVGSPATASNGSVKYLCKLTLEEDTPVNEALYTTLNVSTNGKVVFEQLIEVESANISVSFFESPETELGINADEASIGGVVHARLGIASVEVDGALADLDTSPDGTVGQWSFPIDRSLQAVSLKVTDQAGNQLTDRKRFTRTSPDSKVRVKE